MTATERFLDALRRHVRQAVLDPDNLSDSADALARARTEATDADPPPLLVRVARALQLDETEAAVLAALAAAETDAEIGEAVGQGLPYLPLGQAIGDDSEWARAATRACRRRGPLVQSGLVLRTPTFARVRPELAAVLLDPDPDADALADVGLDQVLGDAPPADAAGPFEDDLDFFECAFPLIRLWTQRYDAALGGDPLSPDSSRSSQSLARLEAAERRIAEARAHLGARLDATRAAGRPLPRAVALGDRLGLGPFERDVVLYLCAATVSPLIRQHHRAPQVEQLVGLLTTTFREGVDARAAFYRDAPLVTGGVVEVDVKRGDLNQADVVVDPRTVDALLGLDAEAGQVIEGSHLFTPSVRLADVHLPAAEKARVVAAVAHYEAFRRVRAEIGLDERIAYGRNLVLLFHGPPGTGKTMLAHALAGHLGKRLLLVNEGAGLFQSGDRVFRALLREARLHDAVLFFDEAETFFGGHDPALLTEMERHDGLVVLATNRPGQIDAAMRRRCTVAVRFDEPGPALRRRIWEGLLPERALGPGVDAAALAERFALPGGHVKNAVLTAVAAAAARAEEGGGAVEVSQADLETSAEEQVRARLSGASVGATVPRGGLGRLVLDAAVERRLGEVLALERARPAVLREWGFGPSSSTTGEDGPGLYGRSTAVLFEGPPGTGKTAAAEALAFELGRPLHLVTAGAVLDPYVGETARRLTDVFAAARAAGAVLLLDEADALLAARTTVADATDRYANADTNVLLGLVERHDGLVVLTTNRADGLDPALARRLWERVRFERPGAALRARLWRAVLPAACPLAADVDVEALAAAFALSGAETERAAYRAAARAALRFGPRRTVRQADLVAAAAEERGDGTAAPIGFAWPTAA